MVDFNNETTVGVPAKDVMKIYLLQCKAYVEDCWREYRTSDFNGGSPSLARTKAGLEQLYLVIEPMIERHWQNESVIKKEEIIEKILRAEKLELLKIIILFNRLLDKLLITKLDTKQANQYTWEASNRQHGR